MSNKEKKILFVARTLGVLFFIAALPWPEIFYDYLRIIVFISIGFILLTEWAKLKKLHLAFLASILIIDNPFLPFYFPINVWTALDILIGSYLIFFSRLFRKT